jgi:hypothetical protein
MSDVPISFQEPTDDANYQVAIQQLHTEITRLNQKMEADREDIDRLKSETDLLKVETRAILATLGVAV